VLVRAAGRPLGPLGGQGEAVDNVSAAEFILAALRTEPSQDR
jgi:cytoskeleton protein RodZ